jgi:hypothetical protein
MTINNSTTGSGTAPESGGRYSSKNCVTVHAQPAQAAGSSAWDVYWRIGKQRQGICRTTIDSDLGLSRHDGMIVAELSAMQWLLEERHAAGKTPNAARTVLVFSGGAPAKLAAGKSSKTHLYPYSYFLTTRFAGAAIVAEQNSSWILPRAQNAISDLPIHGPTGECLTLPGIGPVWLTHHLMRQFRMRLNNVPQAQAWQALQKLLTRCRLQPLADSPGTAELAAVRHRNPGVRLIDPQSHWVFVMTTKEGRPTLTTAYIKA